MKATGLQRFQAQLLKARALVLLRNPARNLRGLRYRMQISAYDRARRERVHLLWMHLDELPITRKSLVGILRSVGGAWPEHVEYRYVLHLTRTSCASFADVTEDVTEAMHTIDNGG